MTRDALIGSRQISFPGDELSQLEDSTALLKDVARLRERFEADGYLLLRGLLPRGRVLAARKKVETWLGEGADVTQLRRRARSDATFLDVAEHPALFELTSTLLGVPTSTFAFKWVRAVAKGAGTGAHLDAVYMGRGSANVRTIWMPLGDVAVEQGTPAICEGSHRLESYAPIRRAYGAVDVDRDRVADTGWFSTEPLEVSERYGGRWKSADFEAGDIVLFGLHTMHASTGNTTEAVRLSCDVRFQPDAEAVDERWVGPDPVGHTAFGLTGPGTTTILWAPGRLAPLTLIALYGTLKVGYFNYEAHLEGETPIETRRVLLPFQMYANDEYPMLVPSAERHSILIELFAVGAEKLRELDALEEPYGYWRETVFLEEISNEADIYLHAAPPPSSFHLVASGDWRG